MSEEPPDRRPATPPPTSDVGSGQENELPRGNMSSEVQWKELLEMQNRQMLALIDVIKNPGFQNKVNLPEFNPDKRDTDARSWCATVDLCFNENPLEGGQLIMALSKSLKGAASTWMSQITYPGITWSEFKELFTVRFVSAETSAATLINLNNEKPKDTEPYGVYASRLITSLMTRWKNVNTEHVAVSVVLAHLAQFDNRLNRLAFTTEITTRQQLQKELQAFSYLKRKATFADTKPDMDNVKRPRFTPVTPVKCYGCGKLGHKQADCRFKQTASMKKPTPAPTPAGPSHQQPSASNRAVICFKCGQPGHIATRCTTTASSPTTERRVNLCTVEAPSGQIKHQGQYYKMYYDSGAECSLIKESVANKFSGKRNNNAVSIVGIGNGNVVSVVQILSQVEINGFTVEILFHVLPDVYLRWDLMLGREILSLGFCVYMDETEFRLSRSKVVNTCSVGSLQIPNDFSNIDTDIPAEIIPELVKVLQLYSQYFINGFPTTRVKTGELEIRLIDANRTVQRRPYRLSAEERKIMRERVDELLRANIIRPSNSPFASPALLVKKQDGSDRMCIDYRELNSNTVPDHYPIPLISDQISRLAGANYFTKLDCASGFHLIPVQVESIERTSFVTAEGQYEFLTMPFGLRNAISVFQRAIVNALGELAHQYVVVYVDDVLVIAQHVEQGIERLNTVLKVLTEAGFSLNMKKCSFMKTKVEYLGFEVEAGQIRPNKKKVEALSALPPPQSVTQVRQFIGLASYFRQFIPDFSRVMAPLHILTSKGHSFEWKPKHEEIRQQVIKVLTQSPVLMIFDPQHPIELHTDASADGYGAILLQIVEGKRKVIAYFSKRTSGAESRYHSYELETLAVVNAIKHFRQYLHGHKFTVVTDCNSLKSSQTKKELSPRVYRWWMFLQSFDFNVTYKSGTNMAHVDFFSRNHLQTKTTPGCPKVVQKQVNMAELSENWLHAEQQRDEEIKKLIADLKEDRMDQDIARTYEVRSGVLYRKVQRNNRSKWLPIVPRAMRWSIINNIHESLMHLGWEKTLEKLYNHYWFEGMSRYVRKFTDNCVTCKIAKPNSGKAQAELHPIPKVMVPWHTVHIDATGKLSGKSDKKEYVFVIIDAFTKYVLLYHTKNIDTKSSIQAVKYSVSLFGAPVRVIADQGRCFASQEFREFCESKNILLHLIATGTSRANGQVERVMSVLKGMLTAVETSKDRSWQDALADVQLAINCTANRVTKASPLELLIGKVARPLDLMAEDVEPELNLDEVRQLALEGIEKNAQYDKQRFDKSKAKLNKFSIGDFVLMENEERNQTKLDPKFKGPFQVVEVLEGDRYLLKSLNSRRTYKYAHDRLKKMPEGQIPVEIPDDDEVHMEEADE